MKLELMNFRQYINEKIEFSLDPQKNVTLIIGDGGAGKTTLSQAFIWVLYGTTEFKNSILLNSKIASDMTRFVPKYVQVNLHIIYKNRNYIIERKQKYTRTSQGNIRAEGNSESKMYQVIDGNQSLLSDMERYSMIREILPSELSRYFFFDGEKIEKMSKEIERGKSEEFSNAVQGLLGLSALKNLKKHFDPSKTGSVYRFYDKKIEESSDNEEKELYANIQKNEKELNQLHTKINSAKAEIEEYKTIKEDIFHKLQQFKEIEGLQNQYRKLENERCIAVNQSTVKLKSFLSNLHSPATVDFFAKSIMEEALKELKDSDKIDKGIPDIQARTIDYLLSHKKCICGHCLEEGSAEYNALIDLKDYIPPKSVGGAIHDLATEIDIKVRNSRNYYGNMKSYITDVERENEKVRNISDQIARIDQEIVNSSESQIRELKNRQIVIDRKITELNNLVEESISEQGRLRERINRDNTRRDDLLRKTNSNSKYIMLRNYARAIYDEVCLSYDGKEREMRKQFQETINEMYKEIYGVGIHMEIDSNYNITVQVDEVEEEENDLDHSTSQNYSVIFSFIATIMKMNHAQRSTILDEAKEEENYPLVMDAPLSAFDKSRIANICRVLPDLAEQIVMFIKDTDGDIAHDHLLDKIGCSYRIKMNGLIDSTISLEG